MKETLNVMVGVGYTKLENYFFTVTLLVKCLEMDEQKWMKH